MAKKVNIISPSGHTDHRSKNKSCSRPFKGFVELLTVDQRDQIAILFLIFGHLEQWKMPKSIKIFAKVGSQFCQILNSYSRNSCQTLNIISPNLATLRLTLINGSFLLRRGRDNESAFALVPSVRFKKNASTSLGDCSKEVLNLKKLFQLDLWLIVNKIRSFFQKVIAWVWFYK